MPQITTWTDERLDIANQRFTVHCLDAMELHQFFIYTVQSGPLANQRIIKHKAPGQTYKGFAFLMDDCTIRRWRSAQAMDEHVFSLASDAIAALFGFRSYFQHFGQHWTIESSIACLRCNTPVSSDRIYCDEHVNARREFRDSIEADERAVRYTAQRERRIPRPIEFDLLTAPDPPSDPPPVQSRTHSARQPLSENGTGLIR